MTILKENRILKDNLDKGKSEKADLTKTKKLKRASIQYKSSETNINSEKEKSEKGQF